MSAPAPDRAALRELASLALILALASLRAISTPEPFPAWGDDPTRLPGLITGITPAISLAIDSAMIALGAFLIFSARRTARADEPRGAPLPLLIAFAIGSLGVTLHAAWKDGADVDPAVIGTSWSGALAAGLGIHAACRREPARRLAASWALALIGLFAVKGAMQYFIEQPRTWQDYLDNRENYLAAQGWSSDSSMRMGFERRLSQREASGWFGFSNVFASFAATSVVGFAAIVIARFKRSMSDAPWEGDRGRAVTLLPMLGLLVSLAALGLSGSKGGIGAAIISLTAVALASWASNPRRSLRPRRFIAEHLLAPAGIGVIVLVIFGVALRGQLGDRLSELSLRFRWFYQIASFRMLRPYGPWGTGPAGYQDAYLLYKVRISPEAIQSPHSILFDWSATLGLCGFAWCAILIAGAGAIGRALAGSAFFPSPSKAKGGEVSSAQVARTPQRAPSLAPTSGVPAFSLRTEIRILFLIAATALIPAAFIEVQSATVENAIVRFCGLALFTLLGAGGLIAFRASPRLMSLALASAAIVLLAHAQIEMTASNTSAAACCFAILAIAAAGPRLVLQPKEPFEEFDEEERPPEAPRTVSPARQRATALFAASLVAVALATPLLTIVPIARWERALRAAATIVEPLPEFEHRARELSAATSPARARELATDAARELSAILSRTVDPTPAALERASLDLRNDRMTRALVELHAAQRARPDHFPTARAASTLLLQLSRVRLAQGDIQNADGFQRDAESPAASFADRHPRSAQAWGWLGTLRKSIAERDATALARAIDAWERAARNDPYTLLHPIELARANARLGRADSARGWAQAAIDLNQNMRLDPLMGLTESQRAEMQAISRQPATTNPGP